MRSSSVLPGLLSFGYWERNLNVSNFLTLPRNQRRDGFNKINCIRIQGCIDLQYDPLSGESQRPHPLTLNRSTLVGRSGNRRFSLNLSCSRFLLSSFMWNDGRGILIKKSSRTTSFKFVPFCKAFPDPSIVA